MGIMRRLATIFGGQTRDPKVRGIARTFRQSPFMPSMEQTTTGDLEVASQLMVVRSTLHHY